MYYKKTYNKESNPKKWSKRLIQMALLGLLLAPILVFGLFVYYTKDLPRPEKFTELTLAQPTRIYDRTGTVLLYEVFGEEKREIIPLAQIPQSLQRAVIATEDAEFYDHFGISLRGTGRALLINLGLRESQSRRPGGSTITQQLARNSFLTQDKNLPRKIREFILTLELERSYSKNDILGFYLNQIPFGSNAYGIGAATDLYFEKKPSELTIAESALMAALIQAPTYYSPHGSNTDALFARKDFVLRRMQEEQFITPEEYEKAVAEEIAFQDVGLSIRAPHFVLQVVEELMQKYGEDFVRERGLRVTTSLDWELQQLAEQSVEEIAEINTAYGAHNAAFVAINPQTGEVLAMVGSKDWFAESYPEGCTSGKDCLFDPKVNVATYYQGRQPGSAFKPFVYALAFQKGADGETIVVDEQTNFGVWGGKEYIPQNYTGTFRGPISLREALAQSINIPAVKVLVDFAGIEESVLFAEKLGITTLREPSFYGPALVLGGGEVRLIDMVSAYGVFASEGKKIPPVTILRVDDTRGNVLEQNHNTAIRILSPDVTEEITSILADNEARAPLFGPRSSLYIPDYDVAVKTGTTQEYKDAWTLGYTSDIVAGVWVGNNDNTPTSKKPGVTLAAPIWNHFMAKALPYLNSSGVSVTTP
jgi:membrane peptidoglycan carboxypeptidase